MLLLHAPGMEAFQCLSCELSALFHGSLWPSSGGGELGSKSLPFSHKINDLEENKRRWGGEGPLFQVSIDFSIFLHVRFE